MYFYHTERSLEKFKDIADKLLGMIAEYQRKRITDEEALSALGYDFTADELESWEEQRREQAIAEAEDAFLSEYGDVLKRGLNDWIRATPSEDDLFDEFKRMVHWYYISALRASVPAGVVADQIRQLVAHGVLEDDFKLGDRPLSELITVDDESTGINDPERREVLKRYLKTSATRAFSRVSMRFHAETLEEYADFHRGDEVRALIGAYYNLDIPIAEAIEDTQFGHSRYVPKVVEGVLMAQAEITSIHQNHAFVVQCLSRIQDIANSDGKTPVSMKSKSGSMDDYYVSGVPAYCKSFLEAGGNAPILGAILTAATSLINEHTTDPGGYVYATPEKILSEMSRTSETALVGRKYPQYAKLVNSGLMVLSTLSVEGTDSKGDPVSLTRFLPAQLVERAAYNGVIYKNVWEFDTRARAVWSIGKKLKQTRRYSLMERKKPLKPNDAGIREDLTKRLNQARRMLYTAGKSPKQRKLRSFTITLSWDQLFSDYYPNKEANSRQKKKLVEDMDGILREIAEMDFNGKMQPGRPLYIKAHTEYRQGSAGGRKARDKLIIECSSVKHRPNVDLLK